MTPWRPKTLLEHMKAATAVAFSHCDGEYLWYGLYGKVRGPQERYEPGEPPHWVEQRWTEVVEYVDELLVFRIPLADTKGGAFRMHDDNCMYFMRWIRKELELRAEEASMIEQARKDWNP